MSRTIAAWAGLASLALLAAAGIFQFGFDMHPCKLCIWQRYPHVVAALSGAIIISLPFIAAYVAGTLGAMTSSAIGFYHVGVEQKWWEGPTSCTSSDISGLTTEQLFDQIMSAPVVRCDEIPWDLFGISMAGWNGLISAGLALAWAYATLLRVRGFN